MVLSSFRQYDPALGSFRSKNNHFYLLLMRIQLKCSAAKHHLLPAILAVCFLGVNDHSAQAQVQLNSGDRFDLINVGLGMSTRGLPIYAGIEQSIDDHISAGLMASFQSYGENSVSGSWTHQYFGIGLQGHYHFIELAPPPFDFYAGLTLGWFGHKYRWADTGPSPGTYTGLAMGGMQLAGHLGGRYTYKDWTMMAQLSGGSLVSGFLVGLSFPLK
jgi:outer membrane immunogenic protein